MKLENIFARIKKAEVVAQVTEGVFFSYQYVTLLVLSVIIATLGLLIENSAIIIGAMILSPIIWPILGVALATVTSKKKLFLDSLKLLLFSIVFTVLVAFVISLASPIKGINDEIALRINPTFIDLVVALAAGLAAALVLAWPRFSAHIAGVAVAASVLPPICVTGIGLALSSPKVSYGSFVLFITNLSSIIFAGIVVFTLIGFFRKDVKEHVRRIETGLILSFLVILFLSFQLLYSLNQIIFEDKIRAKTREILAAQLQEISNDIKVADVHVAAISAGSQTVDIVASIEVPSEVKIDINEKNQIGEILDEKLKRETNLEFRILPVLNVAVEVDKREPEDEKVNKMIREIIAKKVGLYSPDIVVESIKTRRVGNDGRGYAVETTLKVPHTIIFDDVIKEDMLFAMIQELKVPLELEINIIRFEKL